MSLVGLVTFGFVNALCLSNGHNVYFARNAVLDMVAAVKQDWMHGRTAGMKSVGDESITKEDDVR